MALRTSKQDIQTSVLQLASALGATVGTERGQWQWSNSPLYGGVVIEEVGTGVRPFGDYSRMPPKQFVAAVDFALKAIHLAGEGRSDAG